MVRRPPLKSGQFVDITIRRPTRRQVTLLAEKFLLKLPRDSRRHCIRDCERKSPLLLPTTTHLKTSICHRQGTRIEKRGVIGLSAVCDMR
jgi:hypothetical protein